MKSLIIIISGLILFVVTSKSLAACDAPEYRQFDFWLGHWRVETTSGQYTGTNHIFRHLNNCTIKEEYQTPNGYAGESINIFDATTQLWHQMWVDNTGVLLSLKGQFDGTSMILSGSGKSAQGNAVVHRITWTPNRDGSVRQHWQSRPTANDAWTTLFDGRYVKRKQQNEK